MTRHGHQVGGPKLWPAGVGTSGPQFGHLYAECGFGRGD
jgi:hypothetical protein